MSYCEQRQLAWNKEPQFGKSAEPEAELLLVWKADCRDLWMHHATLVFEELPAHILSFPRQATAFSGLLTFS